MHFIFQHLYPSSVAGFLVVGFMYSVLTSAIIVDTMIVYYISPFVFQI